MTQDTRKDKRAKVVSLNVRYKSATVDEFIENHSHDVSKGGIFVKTPTPFPPGTLLKFEIRLAGDKSVISGVGRVVWKREPTQAATEKPAGMGVKFIKIDDASRVVIDQLTSAKADAGRAYTSDPAGLEDERAAASTGATGATSVTEITAARSAPTPPESAPAPQTKPLPATPAAPASSPAIAKTASVVTARPTVGAMAKTLPLGSVPPANLGPTTQKSPSITAIPAASAAPAPTPAAPPTASGPPAPIKLRPATAIGVAPQANTPQAQPAAAPAPTPSAPHVAAAAPPPSNPAPPAPVASTPRPMPNPRKATMMGVAPAANPVAMAAQAQAKAAAEAAKAAAEAAKAAEASGKSVSSSGLVNDNDDTQQFFQSATPKAPAVGAETPKAPPATMADAFLGGIDKPAPEKPVEKKPAAGPMFPISDGPEEPVKEPTMMKQAAELLEEALREAGGSMEEIGQNPLFNQQKPAPAAGTPPRDQSGDTVVMSKSSMSTPPPPVTQPVARPSPSIPLPTVQPVSTVVARSVPPPAKPIGASLREPEKKSPTGLIIGLLAIALLVGGGVFAYSKMSSKTDDTPKPPPSATASATPLVATPDAGAPLAVVDAGPSVVVPTTTVDAGSPATETAATKDAGAAPDVVATAKPVVKPRPKPKPKPTATATSDTPSDTPPAATTTEAPAPPPPPPTADPMQTAPEL